MVIDIVDLNDEKYKNLSNLQYAMIYAAQTKKNLILQEAEDKKTTLFLRMLSHGVARSTARADADARIDREAEAEVAVVKEDLEHQLAYDYYYGDGDEHGLYRYPENPNYNLSYQQRYLVVRDYYMHLTTDPAARLDALAVDSLARTYLGEFYRTLYELLTTYVN